MSAYYMIKVIIGRVVVLPKRKNNNLLFSCLLVPASGRVLYWEEKYDVREIINNLRFMCSFDWSKHDFGGG